eukprot:m.13816 g.13816  ORF g.13816 m.13816 type:complete len:397 (-) comp9876_c1_seq1:76-1266(-)
MADNHDETRTSIAILTVAISRSADWLKANLPQTKASFNNGNDQLKLDCSQYMLLPVAYQAAGLTSDANWAVRYIEQTYLKQDGSGCTGVNAVKSGSMIPYSPAWTAISCSRLGRQDMAQKIMRQVLRFQGKGKYGGFYGGEKEVASARGVFCFDSCGAGILACVFTAHLEEARRGGEYLLRLAELSTDKRWYWAMTPQGTAIDSFDDPAWLENSAMPDAITNMCYMEKDNEGQAHWKTGFYLACCAHLYKLFDDDRFLAAANQCADFALATRDSSNWKMFGHKLAWGAAELYKVSRDPKVLKMATELGLLLAQRQNTAGWFPYTEWFLPETPTNRACDCSVDSPYCSPSSCGIAAQHRGAHAEPATVTYSICAQCTIWMSKVKEALEISMEPTTAL